MRPSSRPLILLAFMNLQYWLDVTSCIKITTEIEHFVYFVLIMQFYPLMSFQKVSVSRDELILISCGYAHVLVSSPLRSSLKGFFYRSSNLQYFKRLIQIPLLPEVSLSGPERLRNVGLLLLFRSFLLSSLLVALITSDVGRAGGWQIFHVCSLFFPSS